MKEIKLNVRGKYGSAKDKALTVTERLKLFDVLLDRKDRVILILGALAGMRQGEMVQCRKSWLSWKDFGDTKVLVITIPNECRNMKMKYEVWRPKVRRGRITYVFNPVYARELFNFYQVTESINLVERNISEYRVKYKMGDIINRKISGHCLRAGATYYLRKEVGLDDIDIASMLGHKDLRTTHGHYTAINTANTEASIMQIMEKKE